MSYCLNEKYSLSCKHSPNERKQKTVKFISKEIFFFMYDTGIVTSMSVVSRNSNWIPTFANKTISNSPYHLLWEYGTCCSLKSTQCELWASYHPQYQSNAGGPLEKSLGLDKFSLKCSTFYELNFCVNEILFCLYVYILVYSMHD